MFLRSLDTTAQLTLWPDSSHGNRERLQDHFIYKCRYNT